MERAFRNREGGPTAIQYTRKADMLLTAISNLNHYKDDYSTKTCVHILNTLKDESPIYNEIIASLKKSSFSNPAIKAVIDEARQENGNQDLQHARATGPGQGEDRKAKAKAKASPAAAHERADRSLALALDLQEKERRSEAAKKGWATRRQKQAMEPPVTSRVTVTEAQAAKQRQREAARRGWETRSHNQALNGFTGSSLHSYSGIQGGVTKADGTPDMRYRVNRAMSMDYPPRGPTKADGTPDMRYKVNRAMNMDY